MDSHHKVSVMRKAFPCHDVMICHSDSGCGDTVRQTFLPERMPNVFAPNGTDPDLRFRNVACHPGCFVGAALLIRYIFDNISKTLFFNFNIDIDELIRDCMLNPDQAYHHQHVLWWKCVGNYLITYHKLRILDQWESSAVIILAVIAEEEHKPIPSRIWSMMYSRNSSRVDYVHT